METILVVDDNTLMRKALTETLKVLNYNTIEAGNGLEALEALEINSPGDSGIPEISVDLIMSDLAMPVMDGMELFIELKKRNKNIPVVMLSGYMIKSELDELQKQGLAGWLMKPADITQIAGLLEKLLH